MKPFLVETDVAAPLPQPNVDTDGIMPKQILKRIDREGLAGGAFHDLRFDATGGKRTGFVLNQASYDIARFPVCASNFGCGSSREYAVWDLMQIGIRAIIARSFAGIFFGKCEKNGLLAITLPEKEVDALIQKVLQVDRTNLTIDLGKQTILTSDEISVFFEINPARKQLLMDGADHIEQTLAFAPEIQQFEEAQKTDLCFLWKRPPAR
ncbi:3-isopropylmalate dehydratase small subunit [Roseibium marinum]|uniref:3-isopropylmalate dehydratase n=1 Tax=Roseibium marinum TaxID=281252 RepID=A0A2S3UPP5_9HYPH|nr:3-isopropylmalate dehydratase small subunit [Roseibium marinum]POF29671.1 3-isopropylmalate/(R)-2-methylmalate dehydratase small subunit [Roseibium marinum]